MLRSVTTRELVAAVLRPVRSTMSGVARRMGVALAEEPEPRDEAGQVAAGATEGEGSSGGNGGGRARPLNLDVREHAADPPRPGLEPDARDPGPDVPRAAPGEGAAPSSPSTGQPGAAPSAPSRPAFRVGKPPAGRAPASPEARPAEGAAAAFNPEASIAPSGAAPAVPTAPPPRAAFSTGVPPVAMRRLWSQANASPPARTDDAAAAGDEAPIAAASRAASINSSEIFRFIPSAQRTAAPGQASPADRFVPSAQRAAAPSEASHTDAAASMAGAPPVEVATAPSSAAGTVTAPRNSVPSSPPLRLFFDSAAGQAESSPRPPAPRVEAALADRVAQGAAPIWDEAHRVTSSALAVERALGPDTAAASPPPAVSNTFNVSVHVDPNPAESPLNRDALEQALCEILRDAARRNGLEV